MATRNTIAEGAELKRIREAANLSREELAARLGNGGYQDKNVKAIERGSRVAGLNVVSDWAAATGSSFGSTATWPFLSNPARTPNQKAGS